MPLGPGKYDDACTAARLATEAEAVALIVIGGKYGSGFSVQAMSEWIQNLPALLRHLADEIEASGSISLH